MKTKTKEIPQKIILGLVLELLIKRNDDKILLVYPMYKIK